MYTLSRMSPERVPMDPTFVPKIAAAYWLTRRRGVLILNEDWLNAQELPPVYVDPNQRACIKIERASSEDFGLIAGYYCDDSSITFVLNCDQHLQVDWAQQDFYVVGDFNDWGESIGQPAWKMYPRRVGGVLCLVLSVPREWCVSTQCLKFKFASSRRVWLNVPWDAPNWVRDEHNNRNYEIVPGQTGRHRFYFELAEKTPILGQDSIVWPHPEGLERYQIRCGNLLLSLQTEQPLGAVVQGERTRFAVFAPRATRAQVTFYRDLEAPTPITLEMQLKDDVYWEAEHPANLHGYYYYYTVAGDAVDALSHFDASHKILDPYALATVGREGPGIVVDQARIPKPKCHYAVPKWHDLVIMEGHVRDLIGDASNPSSGFRALREWLMMDGNYLESLGVNALELQPIAAFDNKTKDEYHWGYMPVNFFAPASAYCDSQTPEQITELQALVQTCHDKGLAVIVDVVYNHFGVPNHLLYLDKYHYFEVNENGDFMNHSGCGNDIRAYAPMTKRMIIDSLKHWVSTYDVDGFRFDLAELLGVRLLMEIEAELKRIKPSIVLIAEPWSFRGHIGYELKCTGFASWNDGYRNFVHEYILGKGNHDAVKYYLKGSLSHLARFPAQSVNYLASHDDHCWIDKITTNEHHNGEEPSWQDVRRTHLAIAFLMSSIGIPMLVQGLDMLHSKKGVNNTYQRGDLNCMDYERSVLYAGTHEYCRRWIGLRTSKLGRLVRLEHRPSEGYLQFFFSQHSSAVGVLYNADSSLGAERLLFVINPHLWATSIPVAGLQSGDFVQIGDHERLDMQGLEGATVHWQDGQIHLPELSCAVWRLKE